MFKYIAAMAIIFVASSNAKRIMHMRLTNVSCDCYEPTIVPSFSCQLLKIGKKIMGFGHVYVAKEVKAFEVRAVTKVFRENSSRSLQLVNVRVNACDFLTTVHKSMIFKNTMKQIKKHVNLIPYCPIKAHTNITGNNFYMENQDLPLVLPEGIYNVDFYVYYKKKLAGILFSKLKLFSTAA